MSVKIENFSDKKYLCKLHSGSINEYSPKVKWSPIKDVQSYALILEDPDSVKIVPFIHWYIPYISPNIVQINELDITNNIFKNEKNKKNEIKIIMGLNSLGKIGYHGPCAPQGTGTHHYTIKLYGLNKKLLNIDKHLSIKNSTDFEKKFKDNIIKIYSKTYCYKYGGKILD